MHPRIKQQPSLPFTACSALEQVQGRGSRGRTWQGGRGNFFLSVSFPFKPIASNISMLPLFLGLTLRSTIIDVLARAQASDDEEGSFSPFASSLHTSLRLKWPNDLLWDDKKLGGLIVEIEADSVVVGMGVNVSSFPALEDMGRGEVESTPELRREATSLADQLPDIQIDAQELTFHVAEALKAWCDQTTDRLPTQAILPAFESAMGVGEGLEYQLREDGSVVEVEGLNEDGTLRVRDKETQVSRTLVAEYLV